MASQRKLQSDIDKLLKKVDEGLEEFEDVWDKVHHAANQNQSAKFAEDLKQAIKKLQRHREQIKNWCGDKAVKDKAALLECRKRIETDMERFKDFERETKMKQFSREGLSQEWNDPQEADRHRHREWIAATIEGINHKIDEFEAEEESIKSRKTVSGPQRARLDELQSHTRQYRYHIGKLEQILRKLTNDTLDVEELGNSGLQEIAEEAFAEGTRDDSSVSEYMSQMNDIYGEFDLEDVEDLWSSPQNDRSTMDAAEDEGSSRKKGKEAKKEEAKPPKAAPPVPAPKAKPEIKPDPRAAASVWQDPSSPSTGQARAPAQVQQKGMKQIIAEERKRREEPSARASVWSDTPAPPPHPPPVPAQSPPPLPAMQPPSSQPPPPTTAAPLPPSGGAGFSGPPPPPPGPPPAAPGGASSPPVSSPPPPQQPPPQQPPPPVSQPPPPPTAPPSAPSPKGSTGEVFAPASRKATETFGLPKPPPYQPPKPTNSVPPAPNYPAPSAEPRSASPKAASERAPTTFVPPENPEPAEWQSLLESSFQNRPQLSDQVRVRKYVPRNPHQHVDSRGEHPYPKTPCAGYDDPAMFEKYDFDTLFFIFYYQQGTYQQYLAARMLRLMSWRYHKRYLTWFQRHEEPTVTLAHFEQGTYVYFDYETGWCKRIKADFTFDYQYLEDDLQ